MGSNPQVEGARIKDPAMLFFIATLPLSGGEGKAASEAPSIFRAIRGIFAGSASPAARGAETTIIGENMGERVIPFAERTRARVLDLVPREKWLRMTPRERWKANDGALRQRIGEGDNFRYIGRDPDRPPSVRKEFDLTGSELLRLNDRGVPYEIVPKNFVKEVIGRW